MLHHTVWCSYKNQHYYYRKQLSIGRIFMNKPVIRIFGCNLTVYSHYENNEYWNQIYSIVCVHTECTLTAICFECAFSQSTSTRDLKPVWRWIASWCEIKGCYISMRDRWHEETSNKERNNAVLYIHAWSIGWRNEW